MLVVFWSVIIVPAYHPRQDKLFVVLSRSLERLEKAPVRLNLGMIGPHMTMTYSATSPSNRLGKGFSLLPVVR